MGKSAGVFNAEKLLDLNAWYIRKSSDQFLARELTPFLEQLGFRKLEQEKVEQVVATLKPRSKTLVEMAEGACFYFQDDISYEKKADDKFLKPDVLGLLEDLMRSLEKTSPFNQEGLEKTFMAFLDDNAIILKKIAQPLRVALTGKTASPGIFEVMAVLGREKVIKRIKKAIGHIRDKA